MEKTLKEKILVKEKWSRFLLMLFFMLIKYVASCLVYLIALFQFGMDLTVGHLNSNLLNFSRQLNIYLLQISNFLTFNSDAKPFPFTDWPENQA